LLSSFIYDTDRSQAFLHELVVSKCLRHPNIVPFFGTCRLFDVLLVSEWMDGGAISKLLKIHPEHDRDALVRVASKWCGPDETHDILQATDVTNGLMFISSLDIIHSDLKL
jgi:serine/threonine protein kinase